MHGNKYGIWVVTKTVKIERPQAYQNLDKTGSEKRQKNALQ